MADFREVKTRKGLAVRLYADDGIPPFQRHGAIFVDGGWVSYEWTADGYRNADHTPTEWDICDSLVVRDSVSVSLRCPLCSGTGRRTDGEYCSCNMGVDLRFVETHYRKPVEVVN